MNRDQMKGTAKDIAGKVQRKFGEMTGNENQQIKGGAKQVEGKIQKGVGNVEAGARQGGQAKQRRPGQEDALDQAGLSWGRRSRAVTRTPPRFFYRDLRAPSRFLRLR